MHEAFCKLKGSDRFAGVARRFQAEQDSPLECWWGLAQIRERFRCFCRWAVFQHTL